MAINLKATATLNNKPFIASLNAIAAATGKLDDTAIASSKKVENATIKATKAKERAAKVRASEVAALNREHASITESMRQATWETKNAAQAQAENLRVTEKVRAAYRDLPVLEARHRESVLRTAQARLSAMRNVALAGSNENVYGQPGISGQAASPFLDRVNRAQIAQQKTREAINRSINAETAKATATANKAALAEARHAEKVASTNQRLSEQERALAKGRVAAAIYAQTLATMTTAQLATEAATNRVTATRERLAQAMAKSGGAMTPAVLAAQNAANSATRSYNELAQAQAEVGKTATASAGGLASQRYMLQDMSRMALTGAGVMAALPIAAVATAVSWDKAFASVVRTADPAFSQVESKVSALRRSMVDMVQVMPTSFGDVTEIATLANQMGIAAPQVSSFTRAVAMFSATSGVSVDTTATAFGRLTSIMGKSAIPFQEMADSILKVGVNSVATEDEIINITTQISSIAAGAKFSTKDTIALSGALASVRVPPELSRGVVTRIFGQMDKAVAGGGTQLRNFARVSGMSAEEFAKQWTGGGGSGVFNQFLQGLHELGPAARGELEGLGITSVRDIPVTLRLANAADSDGIEGGLFTQTLRDANNAAGETQRQYDIMAETVSAKLKMLGNSVLAFFDAAGRSSLGPFGDLIDNATKGIRDFTRDIDKPAALIGNIFGTTNGEVLGFVMNLSMAAAGLLAVASAGLKVGSIMKGVAQTRAMGSIVEGISAVIPAFGRGDKAAAAFGKSIKAAGGGATGLLGPIGGVSALFGPMGIAIGAAATGLILWNQAAQASATTTEELAGFIASMDMTNIGDVSRMLGSIKVASPEKLFLGKKNSNPFDGGVESYKDAVKQIAEIREANSYDWFGGQQTFAPGRWIDMTMQGMWDEDKGIQKVDDAIQNLVDAGNIPKAMQLINGLGLSGKELSQVMNEDTGAAMKSFMQNAFDSAGIQMTDDNLEKLARGRLPEVTDALFGVAGGLDMVTEGFDGDAEAMGEFVAKLDTAAASFIDFGTAAEKATTLDDNGRFASFDMSGFTADLATQVSDQKQWMDSITTISQHGSTGVVEALAELGPAGQHAANALAEGLRNGEPAAIEALAQLEESVAAQVPDLGSAIGMAMANQSWASNILGDKNLGQMLSAQLGDDKMATLYDAAKNVGEETQKKILDELIRDPSPEAFETALNKMLLAADPDPISVSYTPEVQEGALAALETKLKAENKIEVDAEINTDTTVGDITAMLDDPALKKMDIDANLTLSEAYATSREFQLWAQSQNIEMYLGANDLPARLTANGLEAFANGKVAQIQLDALPDLAEGQIWDVVALADGSTAFIPLDGNGDPARGQVAQVINEAGAQTATIPIDGDDTSVQGVVAKYQGAVLATAFINVVTQYSDYVAEASQGRHYANGPGGSGGLTMANGGTVDYYANGGVRENHVAQIAPAGSWRVWGEPETGGEGYIPLAPSKRQRSTAILGDIADRFGYSLQPKNTQHFADGGQYMAQAVYRTRTTYSKNAVGGNGITIGDVTFTDGAQRDQFREFDRTLRKAMRGM